MRLLLGIYTPDSGAVEVLQRSPQKFRRADRAKIGYMPQQFVLYPDLNVWENLNFAASLYGVPLRRTERLDYLLELVELNGHENKNVRHLSGGMQRRLRLARGVDDVGLLTFAVGQNCLSDSGGVRLALRPMQIRNGVGKLTLRQMIKVFINRENYFLFHTQEPTT